MTVRWDNLPEFERAIQDFGEQLPADSARWLADEALGDYRRTAPVRTGLFKGGLFTRIRRQARTRAIQFWSQVDYGYWVERRWYPLDRNINIRRVFARVQSRLDRTGDR